MFKKNCRKTKFIYIYVEELLSPENRVVYEKTWKNIVEPDNIIGSMRIACWIPKAANTFRICSTYCFSTAKMVARTCLSVNILVHCLSCCMCS